MGWDQQHLFDALTVRFSDVTSRQDVLRLLWRLGLAMAVFGIFPWRVRAQETGSESQLVKGCKLPGQKCNNGRQDCCARKCTGQKRCGCINKGKEPLFDSPLGPVAVKAFCCSNKLNKRTGECK
jgi:hypothetical protein